MSGNYGYQNAVKTAGIVGLGLFVFAFLYNLLFGGRMGYGNNMYNSGWGLDLNGAIASVLVLAVKLLWLVMIISLVMGVVVLIQRKGFVGSKIGLSFLGKLLDDRQSCRDCGAKLDSDYKFCPECRTNLSVSCASCGKVLKAGWKCCPSCGAETN